MGGVIAGFILAMSFMLAAFNFYTASQKVDSGGHQPGAWWAGGAAVMVAGLIATGLFLHNFG